MVVTNLYFWDEDENKLYFRATRVGGPGERHLYTVTDFKSGRPGVVDCLSCSVTNTRGGNLLNSVDPPPPNSLQNNWVFEIPS